MAETINKPYVLLVEGNDEVYSIPRLLQQRGIDSTDLQLFPYFGISKLGDYLKNIQKVPGFSNLFGIGIIRDADNDAEASLTSTRDLLREAGLPSPPGALQVAVGPPRTAILVLPGEGRPGMLEDCFLQSVGADAAIACIDNFFLCVTAAGLPQPNPPSKARLHAFLASRPQPGRRLSEAVAAGYFPPAAPSFGPIETLVTLLRQTAPGA